MVTCGHSLLQFYNKTRGSVSLNLGPISHEKEDGKDKNERILTHQCIISSFLATNVWKIFWVHVTILTPSFSLVSTYLLLVIPGDKYGARWTFVLTWYPTFYMVVGSRPGFSRFPRFGSVSKGKIENKNKCHQFSNFFLPFFPEPFVITRQVLNNYSVKRKSRWKREKKKS